MTTITITLQRASRALESGSIDAEPRFTKPLIDQLRMAAGRLAEDATVVLQAAEKLANADSVYRRRKASDEAAAVLSSILVDLG